MIELKVSPTPLENFHLLILGSAAIKHAHDVRGPTDFPLGSHFASVVCLARDCELSHLTVGPKALCFKFHCLSCCATQ